MLLTLVQSRSPFSHPCSMARCNDIRRWECCAHPCDITWRKFHPPVALIFVAVAYFLFNNNTNPVLSSHHISTLCHFPSYLLHHPLLRPTKLPEDLSCTSSCILRPTPSSGFFATGLGGSKWCRTLGFFGCTSIEPQTATNRLTTNKAEGNRE